VRILWETDYRPVSEARASGQPSPTDFDELRPYIGHTFVKITADGDPVIVVNSDPDLQKNSKKLDFDSAAIWRILVGGTKLSRGFTVEGLTVSYFRRRPGQGDTLMQAGRWFGYPRGYRDLVRLYIPNEIYDAFEAVLRDEEAFRDELARYEGFDEAGKPLLTPQAVPPLIRQHDTRMKLTLRSKMWNAEITELGVSGTIRDLYTVPGPADGDLKSKNVGLAVQLLQACGSPVDLGFEYRGKRNTFPARTGIVSSDTVLGVLDGFAWNSAAIDQVHPYVSFFQRLCREKKIEDWAVIWPQVGDAGRVIIPGLDGSAPLVIRRRRPERLDYSGSDAKHRDPAEDVVARPGERQGYAPGLVGEGESRGALLVYLVWDPRDDGLSEASIPHVVDREDLTVLLSLVVPERAAPHQGRVLVWKRRQDDALGRHLIAIDRPSAGDQASAS